LALLWVISLSVSWLAAARYDNRIWIGWEPAHWLLGLAGLHLACWACWTLPLQLLPPQLRERVAPTLPVVLGCGWLWLAGQAPAALADLAAPAPERLPDIVLISLDTTRADFVLGGEALTPDMDALAAQGRRFTQAVSTAPLTGPAHASMLTGLSPWEHGLVANGRATSSPTVTEELRQAGYRTGAFVSAWVLDHRTGLSAGFTHYDDRWGFFARTGWIPGLARLEARHRSVERVGGQTVRRALQWLQEDTRPSFLWVHLYDPHAPYDPPDRFDPSSDELKDARRLDQSAPRGEGNLGAVLRGLASNRAEERRLMYRAEVEWTDALVGRLLAGVDPDAVVVLVGDHGESLGDNDYWFNHGARLWEACLRVPLVVRWPGHLAPGSVDKRLVSVADVAALLRAAAGLSAEAGPLGAPEGQDQDNRRVMAYTSGQEAQATIGYRNNQARWKRGAVAAARLEGGKILASQGNAASWYDLLADPGEEQPLPVPEALLPLAAEVEAMANRPLSPLTDEQQQLLLALGYVE
jgi:arylsulfatase A-like enzyme